MNATLRLPGTHSTRRDQHIRLVSVFAAILITLQGLLGPDEEAPDDPSAVACIQLQSGSAGD